MIGENQVSEASHRWLTLLAMCAATFMIQLDVTVVNVALPRIQASLGMGPGGLVWVIGAYALSLAALIPAGGALGDHYGRKRVFLAGMAIFTLGSAACALSPDAGVLIASRAVQGVGGAAMLALTLSIITATFPAEQRAAAIGSWAAIGGTGFGVGPLVGGVLLTYFSWASVFWVNIPLAVVGIAVTVLAVRESRNEASRRLDRVGVVLSASGLVAITLGLVDSSSHPWGSRLVSAPLALGVILLVTFALWERRTPHAMVPPSLLRTRSFTSAAVIYLAGYTAFAGALFYVTLLYQGAVGWSVLRTGASWLFMNLPFLCLAQSAGRLERRFPAAVVVGAGCLVAGAGVLALSFAGPTTPFLVTAVGYMLSGAGFGMLVPALTHVAMRDVASGMSGVASGVLNAARQLGTALGLAVLGTIGVRAAVAHWHTEIAHLAQPARGIARRHTQDVGGARIDAVTNALGPSYRHAATASFVHGYHLAVAAGACCLFVAAVVAAVGFGRGFDRWSGREGEAAMVGATTNQEMACQANSTS